MPENIANHPFVTGSGPSCMRSSNPPTPATSAHIHARIQRITSSGLRMHRRSHLTPRRDAFQRLPVRDHRHTIHDHMLDPNRC